MRDRAPAILILLACLLLGVAPALAQAPDEERVAKVQAAYLLNFARYATWPDTAFPTDVSPVEIVVVGEPSLLPHTRAIVRGEQVLGRPLRVRSVAPPPRDDPDARDAFLTTLERAHLVYLPASQAALAPVMIARLRGHAVVTVSDADGFAAAGGMLQLAVRDGRVVFDTNAGAAEASPVNLSSKVLRLAYRVYDGRRE